MDGGKVVTATFSQIVTYSLTIAVSPEQGGTVNLDPPGGVYEAGTVVTLTAVPTVPYAFSGWTGDLSGTVNPVALTMDAKKTVTATFALGGYKVYLPAVQRQWP